MNEEEHFCGRQFNYMKTQLYGQKKLLYMFTTVNIQYSNRNISFGCRLGSNNEWKCESQMRCASAVEALLSLTSYAFNKLKLHFERILIHNIGFEYFIFNLLTYRIDLLTWKRAALPLSGILNPEEELTLQSTEYY